MTAVPNTQTVVSYSYTIKANGKKIGTLQSFSPDQTRTLERIRELANNTEPMFEILPGRTEFTITCDRFELYIANMIEALGYDITSGSIDNIRDPVQIVEQWIGPTGRRRSVVYDRCWIQSLRKTVREGTASVSETATLWPERVFTGPVQ